MVDQLIKQIERKVGAIGCGRDDVRSGHQRQQTFEGVKRTKTIHHGVLILTTKGFGFGCDLDRLLICNVRTSGLNQAIDFGITDQRGECSRFLCKRSRRLCSDGATNTEELDIAESVFTVVSKGIAFDFHERKDFEHRIDIDDLFDHASKQHVLSEFCSFSKSYGCHF